MSPCFTRGGVLPSALKTNGSELRSLPAISGESVKGGYPLSQDGNDQSELAAARRRRAREFRLPARSAGRTPDGAPWGLQAFCAVGDAWVRSREIGVASLSVRVSRSRAIRSDGPLVSGRLGSARAVRLAGPVGAGRAPARWVGPGELAALHVGVILPRTGAPCPRDSHVVAYCRVRAKNKWQRTLFAGRGFGGKCERGDSPLSQSVTTNRNSPQCACGAQGSFDCRREAPGGSEGGLSGSRAHLPLSPC